MAIALGICAPVAAYSRIWGRFKPTNAMVNLARTQVRTGANPTRPGQRARGNATLIQGQGHGGPYQGMV